MSEIEDLRAEVERWRDKAQEAGKAYAEANSKHHAELDRASRLEGMCDRLAERAAEFQDAQRRAETTLSRLRALVLRDHTPEEHLHEDMGGQNMFRYCAGCGVDLDERECEYLAALADS